MQVQGFWALGYAAQALAIVLQVLVIEYER